MSDTPVANATNTAPITEANTENTETEEVDETLTVAPPTKAEVKEQQKLLKKYGITVNGKQKEIELDLSDDAAVKRYLEQAAGANQRFEEAASVRKQAEQLVKMLKENPKAILKHPDLALDYKKLAAEIMNEESEDMAKTPEQKKIEEMEAKLKKHEEERKQLEDEKRQAEAQRLELEAFQQLDEQIDEALSSTDLPKSPYVVKRISDIMLEASGIVDEKGLPLYPGLKIKDIMPYAEEMITKEIQEMINAKPAILEKLVGKKNLDNYRKEKIAKTKPKVETASQVKDSGNKESKPDDKKDENLKFSKVFSGF